MMVTEQSMHSKIRKGCGSMRILKIYDEKTRMYPSGKVATKEVVYADYPAVKVFTHVIETDENDEIIYAINNLSALRTSYGIDKSLDAQQAVEKIQEIMNTPPEPVEVEPSAEERIAASLEYQNLLSM